MKKIILTATLLTFGVAVLAQQGVKKDSTVKPKQTAVKATTKTTKNSTAKKSTKVSANASTGATQTTTAPAPPKKKK